MQSQQTLVFLLFLLCSSFWVPQIARNAQRNTRKAYPIYFVLTTSFTKALVPMYMYFCPENVLFGERWNSAGYGATILAWIWIQVFLLLVQSVMGPRIFIPDGLLPTAYNYHPVLLKVQPKDDTENLKTCPICFSPVSMDSSGDVLSLNGSTNSFACPYMLTPCGHLFHTDCLSTWLETKLLCPVCRQPLPDF